MKPGSALLYSREPATSCSKQDYSSQHPRFTKSHLIRYEILASSSPEGQRQERAKSTLAGVSNKNDKDENSNYEDSSLLVYYAMSTTKCRRSGSGSPRIVAVLGGIL